MFGENGIVNGGRYRVMITVTEIKTCRLRDIWFPQDGATFHLITLVNGFVERTHQGVDNFRFWIGRLVT